MITVTKPTPEELAKIKKPYFSKMKERLHGLKSVANVSKQEQK